MAGNSVLVTTETERFKSEMRAFGILLRIIGLGFVGMAVYAWFAPNSWSAPNNPPADFEFRILAGLGLGLMLFILQDVLSHFVLRGNWQFNDDGISFTPLHGKARRLAWSEVEAICWGSLRVIFRSGKMKLLVILQWETRQHQDEFEEFLQEKLGNSFDLSVQPVEPLSIRRLLWITVVTTFFTLLWFGGLYLQTIYLDQCKPWRRWGILWFVVPLFLLLWWGANIVRSKNRDRWRLRKSPIARSPGQDAESA